MTQAYLSALGFEPLDNHSRTTQRSPNDDSWRCMHTHAAQDGTHVYLEHPYLINRCRLSLSAAPLDQANVLADLSLDDKPGLEAALAAYFALHGGVGPLIKPLSSTPLRPYRRRL
ncbi:hypothetical protein F1C16_08680 [Hymenobacter sp. NBH84]|uniref:hypothetical protein n=1 Tax=Hymenobacter sp. NBH84 TaxID=2596915 RepID=UPI00162A02F0|nr:hypothetical protein [Hymenobacter sp. NBH84]QNE39619.1 hypothetical protein F1C16_08680 [Hymenobacter sp. NBH84]